MIHTFAYCKKEIGDIGKVTASRGPIITVEGLHDATVGEGVSFEHDAHGMILSVGENEVSVLSFSTSPLHGGELAARTGKPLLISAGEGMLGHTFNALGYTLDHRREKSWQTEALPIDVRPKDIASRKRVSRMMVTGIAAVDIMVPLGLGQRELILGDRRTGKTHFILKTLAAQVHEDHVGILALIGKTKTEVRQIVAKLQEMDIFDHCVVIAACADDGPGQITIAPFTAMAVAEYFRDQGKDSIVIFDDLTTHAQAYREVALRSDRFPGREAYPGDIFYLHARLLERAGNFHFDHKDVSITCLPVAHAPNGEMTGYIQTNLMSMTDGHLYFDTDLFFAGQRPAVNLFLSVSRVGRQTQTPLFRDIHGEVSRLLKKNQEAQRFLRFGPEMTEQVRDVVERSSAMDRIFRQVGTALIPLPVTAVLIAWIWTGRSADQDMCSKIIEAYTSHPTKKRFLDDMVSGSKTLMELVKRVNREWKKVDEMMSS